MMYLWLVPILLFVLLLVLFFRKTAPRDEGYHHGRRRADMLRPGERDPDETP